jgi:hypothetical protein
MQFISTRTFTDSKIVLQKRGFKAINWRITGFRI